MKFNREQEIEAIKENIRIEDLAESLGFEKLKETYKKVYFKSPVFGAYQLVINKEKNKFHDYGNSKGGSVIDFWIEYTGKSYIEAIKELREMLSNAEIKTKKKLNDFKLAEKEFQELLRDYISKINNKTKYLKELRKYIKEMKDEITKEEF